MKTENAHDGDAHFWHDGAWSMYYMVWAHLVRFCLVNWLPIKSMCISFDACHVAYDVRMHHVPRARVCHVRVRM
jgi:hypothetical protein